MIDVRARIEELQAGIDKAESKVRKSKEISAAAGGSCRDWLEHNFPTFIWDAPHLVHIQERLDKIIEGKLKRLMIFCPPRHGKSEMTTIRFPIYYLSKFIGKRVILGAYNQTLADKFSRKARRIARQLLDLNKERSAVEDWETNAGGGLRAVGVGAGIAGQGGDLVIIDDPVKNREEANSETYRERIWEWYTDDLYTRLEPDSAMILIMTRWHEDDLAGRILASDQGGEWEVINLPAFAEENDPLGRDEGEPLWPERFDHAALMDRKNTLGRGFIALYQQRPSIEEGEIIPVNMLRDYEEAPEFTYILQSWDTAFKDGAENDYTVGTTWGVAKDGYYILDRVKDRLQMPELKTAIKQQAYKWDPNVVLIEDAASGQSAIQELQGLTRVPVIAIKVSTGKIARAQAVADIVKSGRVFLPKWIPWKEDMIHQLSIFPNGAHDDDVDSFTMALNYLTKRFANTFAVYPEFNDNIHVIHDPDYRPSFVDFYVGMFVDSMVSAVVIGVTDTGSIVVLKEFSWTGGLDNFLGDIFLTYLKKALNKATPTFFVRSERKDDYWWEILRDHEIDFENLSALPAQQMIDPVKELLSDLIGGDGAIAVLPQTCPDIREGFLGAYCYKARSESSSIEYQEKPVKNKYSRLHSALQVALYEHKDYLDYSNEEVTGEDLGAANDDRDVVSGC